MIRPRTPTILNLSLNLIGALGLALAASSAEASSIPADDSDCGACDDDGPRAQATHDRGPAPTDVAATRPESPEVKATPEFTPALLPISPGSEEAVHGTAQPSSQALAKLPNQEPQRPPANESVSAAATTAPESSAHTPPMAGAVPRTSQESEATAEQPPDSPLSDGSASFQMSTESPRKRVGANLPAFIETSRAQGSPRSEQSGPHPEAAVQQATATLARATTPNQATALPTPASKKAVDLPRLDAKPNLLATDVMSVWSRFGPMPTTPETQHWSNHLPDEAVPTTTVLSPAAGTSLPESHRLNAVAPGTETRAQPQGPEPMLPTFVLSRPSRQVVSSLAGETTPQIGAQRLMSQADPSSSTPSAQADVPATNAQREDLLIEPLATDPVPTVGYSPSPNAGIPSAFGAAWGDLFVSATVAGADRLRNEVDGSISAGFGVGNPKTAIGLELAYNLLSIRNFAENGSFDAKVHRQVYANNTTQAAVAVGWNNFVNYGNDVAGTESSVYGVVSAAHLLQPDHPTNRLPITGTLGVGSGGFSDEDADVGVLAGVGLQVDPRLSLNAAWSGAGLNLAASVAPISEIPLTLNFLYADITNNTEAGSVAVFTVGYGFNFGPRF